MPLFLQKKKKIKKEEKEFSGISNKQLPVSINLKKIINNFRA